MTRVIQPDNMPDTTERGYSQARIDGDRLYISGMVGRVGEFEPVGDDIASQANQAFANIEHILAEVDRDLGDVAKVTSYLVGAREHLDEYTGVWRETFDTEPYPCHTLIGVAELVQEAYLVEIDVEVPL